MNPHLAIYEIAVFLNHNCSSIAKQVHDESNNNLNKTSKHVHHL